MGKALYALGLKMFHLKWWVVIMWLVILGGLGWTALTFMGSTSSSISIPGTQAQKTLDRFKELFPETGSTSGTVVIAAPEGKTLADFTQQITGLSNMLAQAPFVTAAISPFENPAAISKNQTIGYITLQIKDAEGFVPAETITAVRDHMANARINGLEVEAGGSLVNQQMGDILGIGEIAGVVLALVVLVVTLGSLVAAGLPIVTALVTVGISMGGLFALSNIIEITNTAPVLAIMLGLAVGIDYSLFIINRYQTLAKDGHALKEAAGRAIATAGNAVVFAAATVVIALVSLVVVQIPFMTTMGLAAAATVALAALVAITLMPAILGIVGLRLFSKKQRKAIETLQRAHKIRQQQVSRKTVWYRIAETLLKYRKTALLAALVIVTALAVPAAQLQLGLPTDETAAEGSSERKAYALLEQGFGAGYNGQFLLVVEGIPAPTSADKDAARQQLLAQYQAHLQGQPQAHMTPQQQAAARVELEKRVEQYAQLASLQKVAERLGHIDDVAQAQAAMATSDGTKGIIQVTPKSGPSDEATKQLVQYLRHDTNQTTLLAAEGASLGVTGTTALQIDINNKLADALPVYLAVVVGLSLLLLMVAFRSLLIPLKATVGFLLSVAAMFGAMVAIFQWGWLGITDAPGPIVSFIPIIAIGILFGLAMDYEFFLVSGMQEAYHEGKRPKQAVLRGFALGSRVVVAAGFIMVSVFAGFISNHDSTIQSIGFALALGIFVDAFIVRMVIVPIVMSYLGRAAWWLPKWLDKRLPRISIEGENTP